tara:strand:+ start:752 stop:877 length:126 start_codon:yes stop_codon:yes gene_type:complete
MNRASFPSLMKGKKMKYGKKKTAKVVKKKKKNKKKSMKRGY